ncbi:MAG: MFS transporter [Legionellales bacterium]|nr:MFS transporter [Legionellales bacterium]
MKSLDKMPHLAWYFLLCYLAYSSYTFYFVMLEAIRPQLMNIYQLDNAQIDAYYHIFYWGLLIGVALFGILVNSINYRTCFVALCVIQILGLIKLFALSPLIVNTPAIHQFKSGMLLLGVAEGGIFAVIHPLIALIFDNSKQSKTKIMNYLHTNWPLFVILTCFFEMGLVRYHLDWYWSIYAALFLSFSYVVIALFLPLPIQTQIHRTSLGTRCRSTLRPGYILLLLCMLCSTILQYSPVNWIKNWMEVALQIRPLFFLMYLYGIQFVFRLLAGFIVPKISPPELLGLGTILSIFSLGLLSIATNTIVIFIAIGILTASVAWYWPTYIAIVADRYPLSGGLGMGLMNCVGYYSLLLVVPEFSQITEIENTQYAFLDIAKLGVLCFILLLGVFLSFRAQGGYKVLSRYDRSL